MHGNATVVENSGSFIFKAIDIENEKRKILITKIEFPQNLSVKKDTNKTLFQPQIDVTKRNR